MIQISRGIEDNMNPQVSHLFEPYYPALKINQLTPLIFKKRPSKPHASAYYPQIDDPMQQKQEWEKQI